VTSFAFYAIAAVAEIIGCFAFWAWLRLDKSVYWILPGIISLIVFAVLLTRINSMFAGRTFAAYGGVYIVASLLWLWIIEGQRLDKWDILGAIICIAGAVLILFGHRQQV
jgi:small multidrug resistance family-3 protein